MAKLTLFTCVPRASRYCSLGCVVKSSSVECAALVDHKETCEVLLVGLDAGAQDVEAVQLRGYGWGYGRHVALAFVRHLFGREGGVLALDEADTGYHRL